MFHHPQRPSMRARDSSGNQVSLLNDEPAKQSPQELAYAQQPDFLSYGSPGMIRSNSSASNSTPSTPDLMRANSYDSQHTTDPHSPTTPPYHDGFGQQVAYANVGQYKENMYEPQEGMSYYPPPPPPQQYSMAPRPASFDEPRRASYPEPQVHEEEQYPKGAKRYPCRFKDSHGCDRTFTTSGHASRHSKIHTAEKAVQCTFLGCQKKFTRADNMKQHLETHYKDRARGVASKPSKPSTLTVAAGIKKQQRVPSRASSRAEHRLSPMPMPPMMQMPMPMPMPMQIADQPLMDPALFEPYYPPPSTSYNMTGVQEALDSPPMSNGLDALAAAAAQSQD